MTRTTILGLAAAAAMAGIGVAPAGAKPPEGLPDIPGIGEPAGLTGAGPQVAVDGGRVVLGKENSIHIEVFCSTSTKAGCSGELELADGQRLVDSSAFDLAESQDESVFLTLPTEAKRLARAARGWRLTATATVTDSLGRSATDTASVRVKRRTR